MFMQEVAERSIRHGFLSTANWRERVGKKWTDDCRNLEAAKKLRALSADFKLAEADWALLKGHFNCSDTIWLRAVRETNRGIGFVHNPTESGEYVAALLSTLTAGGAN